MSIWDFILQNDRIVKAIVIWGSTSQMSLYRSIEWLLADAESRWYQGYKRLRVV